MPHHPTSWRSILISTSHLSLGLPSGLFPRFPHQNSTCNCPLPNTCYMPCPSHSSQFDHPNDIWWGVQIIKLLNMLFSPLSCYFIPPRPKYSPQCPTLKQLQPTFLPQCERSSFTVILNKWQNYSSIHLNLYILRYQSGRQHILHRMIATDLTALNFFLNRTVIH